MEKPTILIIEDDEDQVRLYKAILQKYSNNCIIKSTSRLEEAKRILLEDKVCLISLDLSLEKGNNDISNPQQGAEVEVSGMRFLRDLRSTEDGKKMNVIVVSGEKQVSNVTKALQDFSALAYYEKPVDLEVYSFAVYSAILHNATVDLMNVLENSMDWNTLTLAKEKWQEVKENAQKASINENNFWGGFDVKIISMQNNFNKQAKLPSNSFVEQALRDMVIGNDKLAWTIVQVYVKNLEAFERAQANEVPSLLHITAESLREFRGDLNLKGSFIGIYEFTRNYAFVLIYKQLINESKNVDSLRSNLSGQASKLTNKQALEIGGLPLDSLVLPEWEVRVWTSQSDKDNFPDLHECINMIRKSMG